MNAQLDYWIDHKFYRRVEWNMGFAEHASTKSHDQETKVGACLIDSESGAIKAIGFNGFVRGAKDKELPRVRPDKYLYMVHAEQNLIANCARMGISMQACELYCTLSPCVKCMRLLFQCGIKKVYVKELYTDFKEILEMKDIIVEMKTLANGYYLLEYKEAK